MALMARAVACARHQSSCCSALACPSTLL
jgi:hypothetical protein